jgi:hypothetical protein
LVGEIPVSDVSDIKNDIEDLEDENLQKRFAALFDDGQGENARNAFVGYCRSRNYHPSDMYILCGSNMFKRLRDMIKRQEKLLDEYRDANRYLFEQAPQLNGGKLILPPADVIERAATFQRLIRRKFGTSSEAKKLACRALDITPRQFVRMEQGTNLTDGLIERLEDLPDQVSNTRAARSSKTVRPIETHRYEEFERRFSYIPKPKKHKRNRSSMMPDDLERIGKIWFGDNWIPEFSKFIGYSEWQLQSFMNGNDPSRYISEETAQYIHSVHRALEDSGGFEGPALQRTA